MKKLPYILITLIFMTGHLQGLAQKTDTVKKTSKHTGFELGLKIGLAFPDIIKGTTTGRTGYVYGGFVALQRKNTGIQLDLLPERTHQQNNEFGTLSTYSLDMALLFDYRLRYNLLFQAGPAYSIPINATPPGLTSVDTKPYLSGVIGLETRPMGLVIFGIRYVARVTRAFNFYDQSGNAVATSKGLDDFFMIYVGLQLL